MQNFRRRRCAAAASAHAIIGALILLNAGLAILAANAAIMSMGSRLHCSRRPVRHGCRPAVRPVLARLNMKPGILPGCAAGTPTPPPLFALRSTLRANARGVSPPIPPAGGGSIVEAAAARPARTAGRQPEAAPFGLRALNSAAGAAAGRGRAP